MKVKRKTISEAQSPHSVISCSVFDVSISSRWNFCQLPYELSVEFYEAAEYSVLDVFQSLNYFLTDQVGYLINVCKEAV